ncbi:MAG: DNA polymerase III subunit beta [Patescibacteria group bacterium]
MQFECVAEYLKKSVSIVERVVGKNPAVPILSTILFTYEQGRVIIAATNLEIGVETSFPCSGGKYGAIAIPARVFSSFLLGVENTANLIIGLHNHQLTIDVHNQQTKFQTLPTNEFPPFPTQHDSAVITVHRSLFIDAVGRVVVAASPFNIRQELGSVLFRVRQDLVCVATDSFRLVEVRIAPGEFTTTERTQQFMIPVHVVDECVRIFKESADETIALHFSPQSVTIRSKETTVYSRLIDGVFPAYEEIIPKQFITECVVDRQELLQHLKQAKLFSGKLHDVYLSFTSDGGVSITSESPEVGQYHAALPAHITGEGVNITLNWKYMIDALQTFTEREVFIGANKGKDAVLFKNTSSTHKHIIMPMRGLRE